MKVKFYPFGLPVMLPRECRYRLVNDRYNANLFEFTTPYNDKNHQVKKHLLYTRGNGGCSFMDINFLHFFCLSLQLTAISHEATHSHIHPYYYS
jgi:hypothetical protein